MFSMVLPESSRLQLTDDLSICRVMNGMWQVSGAHGSIDAEAAVQSMFGYHQQGFTTWDLADHYGPAEDFIGEFRRRLAESQGEDALRGMQAFTKWVPRGGPMTLPIVRENVGLSLGRMGVEAIDLLQFHWWDYQDPAYLDALVHLSQLRDEGLIKHVALTNFDTERLDRISAHGVTVVSNQVQYSLIDRRPEIRMVPFCLDHHVQVLAYGTLCGGLLSEAYLGQPEPGRAELNTASLGKYKQMVDAWGGWDLFQDLLRTLSGIGDKHSVSIANVSVRYVLDRPAVAGVIVGVRLGVSDRRDDNARVFGFSLDSQDHDLIESVLARSQDLFRIIGDCGDEYRR